jgi:hypothetical protein
LIPAAILVLSVIGSGSAAAYDCTNADDDMARLQREKDSTFARAARGITAILPIGIVVHTMKGNEIQSLDELTTDEHNRRLDRRIAQIMEHCKLQ